MSRRFKIIDYALPAIGVGFVMQIAGRNQRIRRIGSIMLGFGLLFVGIGFMKDGFGSLEDSGDVQQVLIMVGENPLLAVLAGTVLLTRSQ